MRPNFRTLKSDWMALRFASAITGLPPSFFERQIARGVWDYGIEFRGSDLALEINMPAFERWVEHGDSIGAPEDSRPPTPLVRRAPSNGPTRLYRHFDASGRLLYVGISLHAIHRLSQHMNASAWARDIARVDVEQHPTRTAALAAEKLAIETEKPLHNVVHSRGDREN